MEHLPQQRIAPVPRQPRGPPPLHPLKSARGCKPAVRLAGAQAAGGRGHHQPPRRWRHPPGRRTAGARAARVGAARAMRLSGHSRFTCSSRRTVTASPPARRRAASGARTATMPSGHGARARDDHRCHLARQGVPRSASKPSSATRFVEDGRCAAVKPLSCGRRGSASPLFTWGTVASNAASVRSPGVRFAQADRRRTRARRGS
jgi:hypothetical protein